MPVNPEIGQIEDVSQITHEPGVHRIIAVTRVHRRGRHTVVSDDDRAAIERCHKLFVEPREGPFVLGQRLLRHKPLALLCPNHGVIVHKATRHLHAALTRAVQIVVGPQTAAEETHVANDHFITSRKRTCVPAARARISRVNSPYTDP